MSVLLDGLMLLLLILNMVSGWRRGFIKVFGGLLALALATLVTSVLGAPLADAIAPQTSLEPPVVRLMCSVVLFTLVYVLMAFLLRSLNIVAKIPLIKQLNKVLGLAVGTVSGVLWVLFAVGVLHTLAQVGWLTFLTPATMEKTWLISQLNGWLPFIG